MVHGGPMAADTDCWDESWMSPANLLCQGGAFVLRPNYHGSSNYGLKWLESITGGKYGDLETVDVEKGVDALIGRGLADGGRLGQRGDPHQPPAGGDDALQGGRFGGGQRRVRQRLGQLRLRRRLRPLLP